MNFKCIAQPCPVVLSSKCVFYEGETLVFTGINTNDNLQTVIEKLNTKIEECCNEGIIYTFINGLTATGQTVRLGGTLTQNTVIVSGPYTLQITGDIIAAKHITTGGTSSQFVKGDGTLDSTVYQTALTLTTIGGSGPSTLVGSTLNIPIYEAVGTAVEVLDVGVNSTVRCGVNNTASGDYSASLGGAYNVAVSSYSFIGGGQCNLVSSSCYGTVTGGFFNRVAESPHSTIVSGCCNTIIRTALGFFGKSRNETIVSGACNLILSDNSCLGGCFSTIVNGCCNTLCRSKWGLIGGGFCNSGIGNYPTILSGSLNCASNYNVVTGGFCNYATCVYATVGGGVRNTASGVYAGVSGGIDNTNCSIKGFIGNGDFNTVCSPTANNPLSSIIVGGIGNNTCSGTWNSVTSSFTSPPAKLQTCDYSFTGNGFQNWARCCFSTVTNGCCNYSLGNYAIVNNGQCNTANTDLSFIGTGCKNIIPQVGCYGFIGTGLCNVASGCFSSIGNGSINCIGGNFSTISGGYSNCLYSDNSFIGGGASHCITTCYSAILGGYGNTVCGIYSGAFGCALTANDDCTFYTNNHCACGSFFTSTIANGCVVCASAGGELVGFTPSALGRRYGSFYDTTDQTAAVIATAYAMKYNNTDLSVGVSVANNGSGDPTRLTVDTTGVYNLQFSAQIQKTSGGGSDEITIWIRKNNTTDVPDSSTQLTLANNSQLVVASWNWFVSLNAGEYVEIMWSTTATTIQLEHLGATAPYPAIPSVIATMFQV